MNYFIKKTVFQDTVNKHRTQDTGYRHRTQTHVKNILVPIHGSIHFYYVIMACTYLLPLSYKLMVISSVATKNKFSGRFILVDLNRFSSLLYTSFSHSVERCQHWQCWHQRILQQQKKLPRVKFHLMIKSLKLILLS